MHPSPSEDLFARVSKRKPYEKSAVPLQVFTQRLDWAGTEMSSIELKSVLEHSETRWFLIALESWQRFHDLSRPPNLAAPFFPQGDPTPDNSHRWLSSTRRGYSLGTTPWPLGCIRCTCTGRRPRQQWSKSLSPHPSSPFPLPPLRRSLCQAEAHSAHRCPFPRNCQPELPIQWRGKTSDGRPEVLRREVLAGTRSPSTETGLSG